MIAHPTSSSATHFLTPLVILRGGPGMSHHYHLSYTALSTAHDTPVLFYDHIDIGESTHLPHKPKPFWTVALFMDELDNLLRALAMGSKFDLLGHLWGRMLAVEYAATRHPKGLRRLIIANALPSEVLWAESMQQYSSRFSKAYQVLVGKHEREGTTSSKAYQDVLQAFYEKHTCQTVP